MQMPSWHPAIALAELRIQQGRLADAEVLLLGKDAHLQALLPMARLHLARGDHDLARATANRGLRAMRRRPAARGRAADGAGRCRDRRRRHRGGHRRVGRSGSAHGRPGLPGVAGQNRCGAGPRARRGRRPGRGHRRGGRRGRRPAGRRDTVAAGGAAPRPGPTARTGRPPGRGAGRGQSGIGAGDRPRRGPGRR